MSVVVSVVITASSMAAVCGSGISVPSAMMSMIRRVVQVWLTAPVPALHHYVG